MIMLISTAFFPMTTISTFTIILTDGEGASEGSGSGSGSGGSGGSHNCGNVILGELVTIGVKSTRTVASAIIGTSRIFIFRTFRHFER
jgi:hypothetical protein